MEPIDNRDEEKSPSGMDRKREKMKMKMQKKKMQMENSNLLVDKKNILMALQKQIEFYFSDSNLYHDSFLLNLLQQSSTKKEVDVAVILNFARIKTILQNIPEYSARIEAIKTALANSPIASFSDTLQKIVRKVPYNREEYKKSDVDKRTIYVENLPSKISHETLAAIFAKVGKIAHISLPKFSNSKMPKGFAFIEYAVYHTFQTIDCRNS